MKLTMKARTVLDVTVQGVNLGTFTQDGAVWNGLRCLCNTNREKIIVAAESPFVEMFSFLKTSGESQDTDIVTMSPSLLRQCTPKEVKKEEGE